MTDSRQNKIDAGPRLACAHIRCGKPASICLVLYRRTVPLCMTCGHKWYNMFPGSDSERIFLAACDDVPMSVINKTASELLAVL